MCGLLTTLWEAEGEQGGGAGEEEEEAGEGVQGAGEEEGGGEEDPGGGDEEAGGGAQEAEEEEEEGEVIRKGRCPSKGGREANREGGVHVRDLFYNHYNICSPPQQAEGQVREGSEPAGRGLQ